jgi:hypothetical protein
MATSRRVTINKTTPTLLFSGVGNVVIKAHPTLVHLGGSDVTTANSYLHGNPLHLNVNSPDELYALLDPGHGSSTFDVEVLEVR